MRHVVDARGTAVALPDRVGRVVSLVPSLTEWLVLAGVGERLVGVTDWCVEPAGALDGLARVRGTKNPDLAAVRGLAPRPGRGQRRGEPQAGRPSAWRPAAWPCS